MTGKQKAAMLLMSMDGTTAAELLRGFDPDVLEEIAVELAHIDARGRRDEGEQTDVVREFHNSLQSGRTSGLNVNRFINETLVSMLDKDRAERTQSKIRRVTGKKDPFAEIRSAKTDNLVLALEDAHPQTIAVVLSELSVKKSQEVLSLLSEEKCLQTVCRLTNPEAVGAKVRERIASMVYKRLQSFEGKTLSKRPEQTLRKLAIMLSGLEQNLRNRMLDEIAKHDQETSVTVKRLMITWQDIPRVADRSLQEALRTVEASKLAIALYGADEDIVQKIRANISERVAAALDEETSLMQEPLEKEVHEAREEVVGPLREANEQGTLRIKQS